MSKLVNFVLLLLLVGLVVRMIVQSSEYLSVKKEHRRLAAMHGELVVKDTSKYLVTSVDTGDPTHFQWRVYFPAGLNVDERSGFGLVGPGGSSFQTNEIESILRCRFDFRVDNRLRVHNFERTGSSVETLHVSKFVAFLQENWNELEITQLGEAGPVEIATDRPLEFLTIKIPQKLVPELEQRLGKRGAEFRMKHPVYQMIHGTPAAFALLEKQKKKAEAGSE